jgi:hypothetical protein
MASLLKPFEISMRRNFRQNLGWVLGPGELAKLDDLGRVVFSFSRLVRAIAKCPRGPMP